jgi:chitinase
LVAPYVDILIPEQPRLAEISKATGLKAFTLAFVLAGGGKCEPMWGAQAPMEYEEFIIKELKAIGGQVFVATDGPLRPI